MKKHYCILLLIFMMACGSQETAESEEITAPDPVDTVAVVDSIGVLMGDSNYVLGSIADFTTLSGGRPAILDRVKGTVAVFDSTGEFLMDFGGFGEGPGEFQRPFHMAALESGIFVVTQLMAPTLALDSTGGYLGNWQFPGFGGMSLDCMPFDDSSFVCYYFAMQMEETPSINYSLKRYHAITGEVLATYFDWNASPSASTDFVPAYITAASDGRWNLYMSRHSNDSWMVERFGEGPEALDTIALFPERRRLPVPDSGFVPGCAAVRYAFSDGDGNMEQKMVNMPVHHPLISQLGVDGDGNIWCRRGGLPGDVWDVVSPEGELLEEVHVVLQDSVYFLQMDVSPRGILGFDIFTEDYHRLLMMDRNYD